MDARRDRGSRTEGLGAAGLRAWGPRVVVAAAVTVVLAAGAAWSVARLLPELSGSDRSYVRVAGASMDPTLHEGDLLTVREQGSYGTGDVVVFPVPAGDPWEGTVVVHRIVGVDPDGRFVTQGDHNATADPWRVEPGTVRGAGLLDGVAGAGIVERAWMPLAGLGLAAVLGALAVQALRRPVRYRMRVS
jgi:signal peptidase I